ncbi:MAG: exonuclease domain-containing protein, partial [Desulfotomaculales bacterium]
MLDSFVVCDLETTGLSPFQNEIIEVGLVLVEGGRVKSTFHTLVRPQKELPKGICRLTGLKDEDFRDSPEIREVLPRVLNFLAGHPLVGHNVSFDRGFLEAAAGKLSNLAFDTLELAKIIFPFSPGYRLGSLCKYLGIPNAREHRALSDALATVTLYHRLVDGLKELDANLLAALCFLLLRAGSSWAGPLLDLASRTVSETGPDSVSFFPGRGDSLECPVQERVVPDLGLAEVARMLAPGGAVAAAMDNYEYRPQQVEMVKAVFSALNENKHLLMEAGTGTGKSLAYLLPLVCRVLAGGVRAVVATHTLNLQSQLWEKDIPALRRMLPWPFTVALVKGRQNYLCFRRWQEILAAGNWSPEEAAFWARILVWTSKTKTGDRAEIRLGGREQDFWNLVSAENESCPGSFCAWYAKGCFVNRVRREAERADIVITNHSLVLADLRAENRLLPPYDLL